jgi:hypothetical protein
MPPARLLPLFLALLIAAPAHAAGEAEARHDAWRDCLSRNFRIRAADTPRERAADAAFDACAGDEEAYLAALAGSPLLSPDDVTRARPLLAGRARAWLVGYRG